MRALLLGAVITLSGCASTQPTKPLESIVELPAVGETAIEELGETLLSYYTAYTLPTFETKNAWSTSGIQNVPQVATPLKVDADFILGYVNQGSNKHLGKVNYCFDRKNQQIGLVFSSCPAVSYRNDVEVIPTTYIDVSLPQYRQELIYGGRSGDVLKFTYREFSNGQIRDAFSQDVSYDLSDGNTVGYKGARIEVLNATNNRIEYRVARHFDR